MGSTYASVAVVGAPRAAVIEALGDGPALVGRQADGVTPVYPGGDGSSDEVVIAWEESGPALAQRLAAPVLAIVVHDSDLLLMGTWDREGSLVDVATVPDPRDHFGVDDDEADDDDWPGHDPERVVEVLGRGDAGALRRALGPPGALGGGGAGGDEGDGFLYADDRHWAVAEALRLPTSMVGWGYGYLRREGGDGGGGHVAGGGLTTVP